MLDWMDRHAWVVALAILFIVIVGGAWVERPL